MKKSIFSVVCGFLFCLLQGNANAQDHAPSFTGGRSQSLSICENAGAYSLDAQLAVIDSDSGQTETWSVVTGAAHGTLVASFTDTSTGGILTPTGLSYTPSTGFSGMDTFSVMVSDGSLTDTTTIYVTVMPLPSGGVISGASSVCVGASVMLTESVGGGSWSITNSNASITGSGSVMGISGGLDTIHYFVVNTCGTAIASMAITIAPLPDPGSISGRSIICIGIPDTLSASASGGVWTSSNSTATVSGGVVSGASTGMDTIIYTITTACGIGTTSFDITIYGSPMASIISGGSEVCVSARLSLTDSVAGGIWYASNASASVSSGVVTGVSAGMDTIKYSVTNYCGTATVSHAVTVHPLAIAGVISGESTVCTGVSTVLSDTISGGVWSASNSHASVMDSLVTGVTTGTDTIKYAVTNSCGTTVAQWVMGVAAIPLAGPITGPTGVCAESYITLSAPTSGGTWMASNTDATLSADTVTGVSIGLDSISYVVGNTCGADTAMFVVTVDTVAPTAGTISGLPVLCVGDSLRMTVSGTGGGFWGVSNSALAHIGSNGHGIAISNGMDTVFYSVTNGCGTAVATYGITINPTPDAGTIMGYDSVCIDGTITLTDTQPGGTWMSANPVFVSVSSSGVVTGLLHGSSSIFYIVANSCGSDTALQIMDINEPAQPIVAVSPIFCVGSTTPVPLLGDPTGGTWSSDNLTVLFVLNIEGGLGLGITVGTTELVYTVNNACGITSDSLDVSVINCAGLSVPVVAANNEQLAISPNPNNGSFTITLPSVTTTATQVTITNVLGEKINELSIPPATLSTEIQLNVSAGVYFLTAESSGNKWVEKVVVGN